MFMRITNYDGSVSRVIHKWEESARHPINLRLLSHVKLHKLQLNIRHYVKHHQHRGKGNERQANL